MESAEYDLMDAAEEGMWWYRALHLRLLGALDGVGGRVLDAGCGTGGFLRLIAEARPDLWAAGVDIHAGAARRAGLKAGRPAACASIERLPFADAAFDAVVSADVLCHRAVDPAAALAEIGRVLRPGGRLVLNLPAYDWLKSAHDVQVHNARRTTKSKIRALLASGGFVAVRAQYWNSLLLPIMAAERKLLSRGPLARSDVKPFPPILDAAFFAVTEAERRLPVALPAGGSVLAVATAA